MITLEHDSLVFAFPEIHPAAVLRIECERTLRIPDDDQEYPLPPGLGRFPLRHVDDYAATVPPAWREHGGVLLPMYQAEALWLNFEADSGDSEHPYPFAVQVATGKVSAITGEPWRDALNQDPQDYLVVPEQPWLDGYCVERGIIRQFVAMPLGDGYTAEEQLTGKGDIGGLQLRVYPMKREVYLRRFGTRRRALRQQRPDAIVAGGSMSAMGLAPGGRMRQAITDDPYGLADWDLRQSSRCFVHLANALTWRAITGEQPPTRPWTAQDYTHAGLPWFDYYAADQKALEGAATLKGLKSVAGLSSEKGKALPNNAPVAPQHVIPLGPNKGTRPVREGVF
jgi:hypothetical protein